MGAESSVLKKLTVDATPWEVSKICQLYSALNNDDGSRISLFEYGKIQEGQNCIKYLRTIRHPSVLRFLDCHVSVDLGTVTFLTAAAVLPLDSVLETFAVDELSVGLHGVVEGLVFLHESCKVCHNNVSAASVFIVESCHINWQLGGFEFARKFEDLSAEHLKQSASLRETSAIAPEEKSGEVLTDPAYGHSRDVYAFGTLVEYILDSVENTDTSLKEFHGRVVDCCLCDNPKERCQLRSFLDDPFFWGDFAAIWDFLRCYTLKTEADKEKFFRSLVEKLLALPVQLVASYLVRHLLVRLVLLDQYFQAYVLQHLFTPYEGDVGTPRHYTAGQINPILPRVLFKEYFLTELVQIFCVRDLEIRRILLMCFPAYVCYIDSEVLKSVILPQVILGIADNSDALVAASLHALGDLVSVLGAETVLGRGPRGYMFSDCRPRGETLYPADTAATLVNTYTAATGPISPVTKIAATGTGTGTAITPSWKPLHLGSTTHPNQHETTKPTQDFTQASLANHVPVLPSDARAVSSCEKFVNKPGEVATADVTISIDGDEENTDFLNQSRTASSTLVATSFVQGPEEIKTASEMPAVTNVDSTAVPTSDIPSSPEDNWSDWDEPQPATEQLRTPSPRTYVGSPEHRQFIDSVLTKVQTVRFDTPSVSSNPPFSVHSDTPAPADAGEVLRSKPADDVHVKSVKPAVENIDRLAGGKLRNSPPPPKQQDASVVLDIGPVESDEKSVGKKTKNAAEQTTKTDVTNVSEPGRLKHSAAASRRVISEELGSEFEIKAISLSRHGTKALGSSSRSNASSRENDENLFFPGEEEPDYFADMAPKLLRDHVITMDVITRDRQQTKEVSLLNKFQVLPNGQEGESSGWHDDGDEITWHESEPEELSKEPIS